MKRPPSEADRVTAAVAQAAAQRGTQLDHERLEETRLASVCGPTSLKHYDPKANPLQRL